MQSKNNVAVIVVFRCLWIVCDCVCVLCVRKHIHVLFDIIIWCSATGKLTTEAPTEAEEASAEPSERKKRGKSPFR